MDTTAPLTWRQKLFQRPFLLSGAIFSAALLLRLVAIERYITPDELIWVYRSVNFREAIRGGIWAETLQAGHPGVLTMWLGAIGTSIQLLVNPSDQEIYQWLTQLAWLTPDNMMAFQQLSTFLSSGRVAVAVVNSTGIVLVFWMARRLLGDLFAVLVMALLILDPFLTGLSGILHVDGLATTFATISLLSLALSLERESDEKRWRSPLFFAALSGSTAALAVLAKSPILLLAPVAALIYFFSLWRNREKPLVVRLKASLILGLAWIGSFAVILFLVFPALWVSPFQVLQTTSSNANRHVEEALRPTFFLGKAAFDHGLLFYPIALAWRMGPVVMIGLMILLGLIIRPKWRDHLPKILMLVLVVWIVVFLAGITLAAKKFDRYALPVVPALALLAAIGWAVWLRPADRAKRFLLATLLIVQLVYMIFVLPYPLAGYNLLLGGPFSAKYVMPIGWGESISSAGSWLSENQEVESKSAISGIAPSLAHFFTGETLLTGEDSYESADYVIVTANGWQVDPQGVAQTTQGLDLINTIRYGGLEQSEIYANPRPQREEAALIDIPQPVTFGSDMQLEGQGIIEMEDEIRFTARWDRQQSDDRYLVKLKLKDSNGHKWSSLATALLNEVYFFPEHWRLDETPVVTYKLELPAAIPPGNYGLELSLVDEATGSQLAVAGEDGEFQGVSYDVGELTLTRSNTLVKANSLDMIPADGTAWAGDSLHLLGHGELPERVISGGELILDLYWQATSALPEGLQVMLQIADEDAVPMPLSRFDSGLWQPGSIIQEKYRLHIPAALDAGEVSLSVKPVSANGETVDGSRYTLGEVEIQAADRLFSLPEEIAIPLHAVFEPGILLQGAETTGDTISPGDVFNLVLYWQTELPTEEPVTAFLHILDEQGNIVAQVDRWPGGLPSNIWAQDQVIIDEYAIEIPQNIEPGTYQIGVGLYMGGDGHRLTVVDVSGQPYADEMILLPLKLNVLPRS